MRRALAFVLSVVLCPSFVRAAQQSPDRTNNEKAAASSAINQNDIQDLRQQVQTMKIMVQRMESNLAFVDTTQSPLKIQFQLEIDMWKTVIGEMEKKLNSSKRP